MSNVSERNSESPCFDDILGYDPLLDQLFWEVRDGRWITLKDRPFPSDANGDFEADVSDVLALVRRTESDGDPPCTVEFFKDMRVTPVTERYRFYFWADLYGGACLEIFTTKVPDLLLAKSWLSAIVTSSVLTELHKLLKEGRRA